MLVSIPVFATYQVCLKYEIDGIAVGMWFFVALALYFRKPSRGRLVAVAFLAMLSVLAHWTSLLFVASVLSWLLWERVRRHDQASGSAGFATALGACAGVTSVVAIFLWLKGGWKPLIADLAGIASTRSGIDALSPGAWANRQVMYMTMNFGEFLPWVVALLAVSLAIGWAHQRFSGCSRPSKNAEERLLPAFFFCTLSVACIWQFAFRQGSFIHVYWQLWFCIPVVALVAMTIAAGRGRPLFHASSASPSPARTCPLSATTETEPALISYGVWSPIWTNCAVPRSASISTESSPTDTSMVASAGAVTNPYGVVTLTAAPELRLKMRVMPEDK